MSWLVGLIGWQHFTKTPNFLKHANADPEDAHSLQAVLATLGLACILHRELAGRMTPETAAFHHWMQQSLYPDESGLEEDPDADLEALYRESVEYLKEHPWEHQLSSGKVLLEVYREHHFMLPTSVTPRLDD